MGRYPPLRLSSEDEDDAYKEQRASRTKRQKGNSRRITVTSSKTRVTRASLTLDALLDFFRTEGDYHTATDPEEASDFEGFVNYLLPEYLQARCRMQDNCDRADNADTLRPLTRYEVSAAIKYTVGATAIPPALRLVISRKLKLHRERNRLGVQGQNLVNSTSLTSLPAQLPSQSFPSPIADSLSSIRTTPYGISFLSRLCGHRTSKDSRLIAVDWETKSPWMELMADVKKHYLYAHPEGAQPLQVPVPIRYVSLQLSHLQQVHDILARAFWDGIDVSDLLQHSTERCSVVAIYGKIVVGVALLSSPQEAYITYLAARAGWDNSHIATTMLHHLIALNPHRDITLHVSANNPAMLLYNRFGFKAEEFVAGFYEDYLDSQSRASINAFRLRLRSR